MVAPPVKAPLLRQIFFSIVIAFWGGFVGVQMLFSFLWSPRKFMSHQKFEELPPCATSPDVGGHSSIDIETATGRLNFHYVAQGTRGKPLMLFLHGFPECWYSWRYQLRGPFKNDYWMVAVDMRGYAGTDKPSGIENYRMDVLEDDVKQLIVGLGYEKCVLVGHDWGGIIAWTLTMHYPDMIEKLIIMNAPNPSAPLRLKGFAAQFKQFMKFWYVSMFQLPILPELYFSSFNYKQVRAFMKDGTMGILNKERLTDDDMNVYLYYLQTWKGRKGPIDYYRSMLTYKSAKHKHPIEPKVLLIGGTGDMALTRPLAEITASLCKDCTIRWLEGTSHWVQQDEPDEVNRHMLQFLRE